MKPRAGASVPPNAVVPPAAAALPRPGPVGPQARLWTNDPETWRPVSDWRGYQVSDLARVRSVDRTLANGQFCAGTVLRQSRNSKGYWHVVLRDGSRSRTVPVHVLVAEAFLGPRPAGMHILHKEDDKDQNTPDRLKYGTPKENEREKKGQRERDERGRYRRGRKEVGRKKGSPRGKTPESLRKPASLESQP